jgi:hypothetical protein
VKLVGGWQLPGTAGVLCRLFDEPEKRERTESTGLYAPINRQMMLLSRVFVKITGGSMWSPDIEYFRTRAAQTLPPASRLLNGGRS